MGAAGNNFMQGSLSVGGAASLGGALIVNKMAGLKVAANDTTSVITAHAVSGRFKPVSGLSGGGTALQVGLASVLSPCRAKGRLNEQSCADRHRRRHRLLGLDGPSRGCHTPASSSDAVGRIVVAASVELIVSTRRASADGSVRKLQSGCLMGPRS